MSIEEGLQDLLYLDKMARKIVNGELVELEIKRGQYETDEEFQTAYKELKELVDLYTAPGSTINIVA